MRKTIFTLGLMLAAALSLTNCTKNEEATFTPEVKVPFELYANMDDTRTTNEGKSTKWEANDEINVFHAVADTEDYVNDTPYVDGAGTPFVTEDTTGKFKGTLAKELVAGTSYDWYVCYPYNSYMTSPNNTTGGRFYIGCRSDQAQTQTGNNSKAHIAGSNYPLYGVAEDVAASETPSITMSHASSLVEFNVTNNLSEAITVNSIVFTVDGNDEKIVGNFYMAIHSGKPTFTDYTYTSNVATLNVADGEAIAAGASAKFYMGIKPFVADDYALTVAINATSASGKGTCTKELPVVSTTFAPGKIKTLNVGFDAVMEEVTEPESNLISTIDNLTAGQYYMAAYLVSYSNQGTDYNWAATPYHLWNGEVTSGSNGDLVTVDYSFNDNILETSSSDSAAVVTLEAVADKDNTYYVKCGGKYLTCTGKRAAQLVDTAVEWEFSAHTKGGICITDTKNNVILGTAGAASNQLRCYVSPASSLAYGVVFFAVEGGGDVELTPSITAENISDVAAEGVTNATTDFSAQNLTEDIVVTCDEIVVTAASVSGNVLTYTVAANSGEAREGWIKLAANDVEVTITVSQLAPISGDTATGTIDFSNIDQRESQDSNSQVWSNAGITLINSKESSTTNVGDYKDPARFYKNSSITISAPSNITKLYFECDGADYATALKNSVGSAATASGTNVTVVLDGTSDTFTATLSEGKVFVNSLTVTYISTGQEIQTLSFDSTAVEATLGQPFTAPTLNGAKTTVTYSSSNTAVAEVDVNTGEVTLKGAGETKITATAEKTDEYFKATASYTLTVIDPNATVDYTTLNTSNVTLSTTGGTSASTAKVKVDGREYNAIKLGANKTAGAWKVTVPAGTTKLHLHLAGWNGESVKVGVTGATVNKSSLSLISDSGITGNSPFTLKSDSSTFYHELTLSNVTADATLTFTATSGKRFVVWGVNAE